MTTVVRVLGKKCVGLGKNWSSQVELVVKNPPGNAGDKRDGGPTLGREDLLEEGVATHSSILAWKIHGQRSLTGYNPWGRKESDAAEHTHMDE